ncbi:MAG: dihydropteroate synthase [Pseudomonadota bacterium]
MSQLFRCGRFDLDLRRQSRPLVMGILNVTPDSFFDGGKLHDLNAAISLAEQMIVDGVDIIDIGGESSRPGATPVSQEQELARIMPVIYALRDYGKPLSVDTYKPGVMREALAAGADMINDIRAFREPGALEAVADGDCGLCLMHMQNQPQTMQMAPFYEEVVAEVITFLNQRMLRLDAAGIGRNRLVADPGFGFGKTLVHNMALWQNLEIIQETLGLPLLVGVSRKAMIGSITGRTLSGRMSGSVVAALAAAERGARIVRVHDVAETVDAFAVWHALRPAPLDKTYQGATV